MASYTFEVREVCAHFCGMSMEETVFSNADEIIEMAAGHIFDFTYPIFDEDYRAILEHKILSHFYMREIGFETVSLWKLKLKNKMNEIMPYYNQLYKSENLIDDPLTTTDYKRTTLGEYADRGHTQADESTTHSGNTESKNVSQRDGTRYDVYSDTPQGGLVGVENNEYLTDARKTKDSNKQTDNAHASISDSTNRGNTVRDNRDGTNRNEITMKGNFGHMTKSKMLLEYRDTFLNIDMEIIKNLESLFMSIW